MKNLVKIPLFICTMFCTLALPAFGEGEELPTFESQAWACAGDFDFSFPREFRGSTNVRSLGLASNGSFYMAQSDGQFLKCPLDPQSELRSSLYSFNLNGATVAGLGPMSGRPVAVNCFPRSRLDENDKEAIGEVVTAIGWRRMAGNLENQAKNGLGMASYLGQYIPILTRLNSCSQVMLPEYNDQREQALVAMTQIYDALGGGYTRALDGTRVPDPATGEGQYDIRNRDDQRGQHSGGLGTSQ